MNLNDRKFPIEAEDISEVLPHRFPFLLVDRVLNIDYQGSEDNREGSTIHALKCVTINEPFFPGHFPAKPIMPGVLIIEALGQACGLLNFRPLPPNAKRWDFFIAGVNDAKFRRPVIPGDRLELFGKVKRDRPSLCIFECEAKVDGQVVAQATIMAKMVAVY